MPKSEINSLRVRAKTNEVRDYHHDETLPGKPLNFLIPGGVIALASIGLIIYIGYAAWYKGSMASSQATVLIALLAPFYIGGVFLFSYGYQLYNLKKALIMTAVIVFITVAFVVIIAVLFVLLSGSSSSSSSSRSSSSSKSSQADTGTTSTSSSSSYHHDNGLGALVAAELLTTPHNTRVVEKEVVKEVPVAPKSIACPFCGKSYVPAETQFACPSCGAATPKELVDQSAAPTTDNSADS